jgi:hypothetical protein
VTVLLGEDVHDGRTYDVTGPEAFTLREAAEFLVSPTPASERLLLLYRDTPSRRRGSATSGANF